MWQAKHCPRCGLLLQHEDPPDASFSALRHIAIELLRWAALAFALAFLWAPAEVSETYAFLAVLAIGAWLYLRPRQRAQAAALLRRRRYRCAQCRREYAAAELP